jgi:hypothetical protein
MKFCRLSLKETNYSIVSSCQYIRNPDVEQLNLIYRKYCQYKKFDSVMPIFPSVYWDLHNEILGYIVNQQIVAFSLIKILDNKNAECMQFAWDYADPSLRLGIVSLENECALYKSRGFEYLYLGEPDQYKQQFNGFEILGPYV